MHAAGQYNQQITVQARAAGQDSYGQPNGTWTNFAADLWAKYMTPGGANAAAERVAGNREISPLVCIWRVRGYRTDFTAAMRVLHGSTVYDIKQVSPDLVRQEFVDLACVIGASEG
jgi:SPP1 family predicted phage head-tail adaptor